jgi:hypothetical protein
VSQGRSIQQTNCLKFVSLLGDLQLKYNFRPSHVFNVDKTGISTVRIKSFKMTGLKEDKRVQNIPSAERGTTTTAVICYTEGQYVAPLLVCPRARDNPDLLRGAPSETVIVCYPSGWTQTQIFWPLSEIGKIK